MSYCYEYPRPAVTVDIAVIVNNYEVNHILLIQRGKEPFKGMWALPGGFLDMHETLLEAAHRELFEETGLTIDQLEQFKTYDALDRDPRHRTLSTVFIGFLKGTLPTVSAMDDAQNAQWFRIAALPPLAFDHAHIIEDIKKRYSLH
ncbi:MAG TPA: NUDIX hydrolase [Salinivirgaceae bacterium]|nr:NUDIX hydrolase [Salinivirgaceae bacterium]